MHVKYVTTEVNLLTFTFMDIKFFLLGKISVPFGGSCRSLFFQIVLSDLFCSTV